MSGCRRLHDPGTMKTQIEEMVHCIVLILIDIGNKHVHSSLVCLHIVRLYGEAYSRVPGV